MLKIAIARLYTKNCCLEYNYENILKLYKEAIYAKVDIVVFPRLAITGLSINNKFFDKNFIDEYIKLLENLANETVGETTKILIGGICKEEETHDSVFFLDDGFVDNILSRKEISKDNIFADYKFFDKSLVLGQINYNKKKISTLISDDIYYNFNVLLVSDNKPDYIFCFDTSFEELEKRKKHLIKLAKFANAPVFYINNATMYQNKCFRGEMILINEDFEVKYEDIYKKDELFIFDIDCDDGTELFIEKNNSEANFDISYLLNKEMSRIDVDILTKEEIKQFDKSKIVEFNDTLLKKYINLEIYNNLSVEAKDEIKGLILQQR